jgi:hypothetical protein
MTATKKSWVSKLALVLVTLAAVFIVTDDAVAQKSGAAKKPGKGSDKNMASKKGVADSLGNKEFDGNKLPGKMEVGIAIGSVVGAIAAIKYL